MVYRVEVQGAPGVNIRGRDSCGPIGHGRMGTCTYAAARDVSTGSRV